MSPHHSTETFQLELRSSPSQQHLGPSRSSSLPSQAENMDQQEIGMNEKSHKLDLYSIPVFLLESLVLAGIAYLAYFVHFQFKHEPLASGFYCDDIAYRQRFVDSKLTEQFNQKENEVTVISLLLALPIVLIIFCELVNSMFGALRFRQIRALCTCCKLHSITRRSIRFSGAYALGFLIVMISCDILADSTGRLRPYFAQTCPSAYEQFCVSSAPSQQQSEAAQSSSQIRDLTAPQFIQSVVTSPTSGPMSTRLDNLFGQSRFTTLLQTTSVPPIMSPISSFNSVSDSQTTAPSIQRTSATPAVLLTSKAQLGSQSSDSSTNNGSSNSEGHIRITRAISSSMLPSSARFVAERKWVDISEQNLSSICQFSSAGDDEAERRFNQIFMSWPSFPAAIFTYACLFVSIYLSFVGTARPFRIITCVLVVLLLLLATVFDVQLVKEHYHHWDDVFAGALLAFIVALFVLLVYLNRFKDTHYYENQKLLKGSRALQRDSFGGYSNGAVTGQYDLSKTDNSPSSSNNNGGVLQNGMETGGNSMSNNDLAMRYFQIPRANYRGAPRPLSSVNQMR